MKSILEEWRSFANEGLAQRHRFDTATDVITDEALHAIKRGINMSTPGSNFIEFSFIDGRAASGRMLPKEIKDLVRKVDGRVNFSSNIEDADDSSAVGSYQESKKYLRIFVNIPSDFSLQDIRPSNLVAKIKSTLRHEFEHTLDSLRGLERRARGLGYGYLEDYKNYFTSPHEVNAYAVGFHKRHKMTGQSWDEIKDNFLSWLKDTLVAKINAEKSWDRIKISASDSAYATVEDIENFIEEVDALLKSRYEERYKKNKTDIMS
jgi:hypothetical protein